MLYLYNYLYEHSFSNILTFLHLAVFAIRVECDFQFFTYLFLLLTLFFCSQDQPIYIQRSCHGQAQKIYNKENLIGMVVVPKLDFAISKFIQYLHLNQDILGGTAQHFHHRKNFSFSDSRQKNKYSKTK